jgi:hypothetical protein
MEIRRCNFIYTKGKNKGSSCNRELSNINYRYCNYHISKVEPLSVNNKLQFNHRIYYLNEDLKPYEPSFISNIFLNNNQLTLLDGIEELINLEIFTSYNNQFRSLKPLSKCKNLKEVALYNLALSNLTFEDFSDCKKLSRIILNSSNSKILKTINNIPNLMEVHSKNNFYEMDMNYSTNNTSEGNYSTNNSFLSELSFKNLNITYTNLVRLDIVCNGLTSLNSIQKLVNLQYLNCSFNQLEYIQELRYLKKLKYLEADNNKLYQLVGLPLSISNISVRENQLPDCYYSVSNRIFKDRYLLNIEGILEINKKLEKGIDILNFIRLTKIVNKIKKKYKDRKLNYL